MTLEQSRTVTLCGRGFHGPPGLTGTEFSLGLKNTRVSHNLCLSVCSPPRPPAEPECVPDGAAGPAAGVLGPPGGQVHVRQHDVRGQLCPGQRRPAAGEFQWTRPPKKTLTSGAHLWVRIIKHEMHVRSYDNDDDVYFRVMPHKWPVPHRITRHRYNYNECCTYTMNHNSLYNTINRINTPNINGDIPLMSYR